MSTPSLRASRAIGTDAATTHAAPARPPLRVSRYAARLRPPEPVIAAVSLLLFLAGCAAVYAATRNHLLAQGRNPMYYVRRDLMNGGIATLLAVGATRANLRLVAGALPALYAVTVLALLVVLSPVGATINGAHAWFKLGPVELEPSEFFKVALVLLTALLLGEGRSRVRELLPPGHARCWDAWH